MHPLALEFITGHGLTPPEFIALAARLGVPRLGLAPMPIVRFPEDRPAWDLRDAGLRRDTVAALKAHGVEVVLGEGFMIHPAMDMANAGADLDLMAELGARAVNCVGLDPDPTRSREQFARFARGAAERGMRATVEFLPGMPVATLADAVDHVRASGVSGAGVLIDAMHFFRSGSQVSDLAALDPALIGHVQLCDMPVGLSDADYMDGAKNERLVPGQGILPLREFVDALPDGQVLGIETPQRSLGATPDAERIAAALAATEALLR